MSGQSKSDDRHRRAVDGLLVAPSSRQARRELGTTAWSVLEEVALDARLDGHGRLLALTNVRRISLQLGISKDTAARALLRLAGAGLVERQSGRDLSGEFTRSVYVVHLDESAGLARAGHRCPTGCPASTDTMSPADLERQDNAKSVPARRHRSRRDSSSRGVSISEQGELFGADSSGTPR